MTAESQNAKKAAALAGRQLFYNNAYFFAA